MPDEKQPSPNYSACEITLRFGDGDYLFKLRLKQIAELERLCGAGIGAIWARVLAGRIPLPRMLGTAGLPTHGQYHHSDLYHCIRLALIGGGLAPVRAQQLVDTYVIDVMPLKDQWDLAAAIYTATIEGFVPAREEDEEPPPQGEDEAAGGASTTPPRSEMGPSSEA